jgi:hypothetical protein
MEQSPNQQRDSARSSAAELLPVDGMPPRQRDTRAASRTPSQEREKKFSRVEPFSATIEFGLRLVDLTCLFSYRWSSGATIK